MSSFELFSESRLIRRARGVFYGWWIVASAVFMLTLMAVGVFQGLGTFLVALERHFGWSRTQLSGAFSLARVEGAILGPIEGFLVDRLGNRRMILIGYVIMGIGFIMFSQVDNLWQFYVAFIVITLGSGLGGWLAIISAINNWFIRQRSMAMSTAMSGIHFGGFLVPLLAVGLESHGFRATTFGIGVFMMATVLPLTWFVIRDRPEDHGLLPDGAPQPPRAAKAKKPFTETDDEPEFTARQALATPAFWILTIVHLSSTVSIVTLALHLVPKLTDMGLTLSGAGIVVLTYTAIALPAQFVAGFLADRLPRPPLIFAFLILQASSMMIIAFAEDLYIAYLFAVVYGIGFGGRIPLLTTIRGEYFGRKAFATIMGLSMFPNNIAMIGAPLFAGYMFDLKSSYIVPFTAFSALNFVGAFLILLVRKPRMAPAPRRGVSRQSAD